MDNSQMLKLQFDIAYGKYLKETYPKLYKKGVKIAVAECGCNPKSIAAFLYATGFIKGCLIGYSHPTETSEKQSIH